MTFLWFLYGLICLIVIGSIIWHIFQMPPQHGNINDPEWTSPFIRTPLMFANGIPAPLLLNIFVLGLEWLFFDTLYWFTYGTVDGSQLESQIRRGLFWVGFTSVVIITLTILIYFEFFELKTNEGAARKFMGSWIKDSDIRTGWYGQIPFLMKYEKIDTHPRITYFGFVKREKNKDGNVNTIAKGYIIRGKEGVQLTLEGTCNWRILKIKNAIIHRTSEIHARLESLLEERLLRVALGYTWNELYKRPDYISSPASEMAFIEELQREADRFNYGIQIDEIQIGKIAPLSTKLVSDLEDVEREKLQKMSEQIQNEHFANMVKTYMTNTGITDALKAAEQVIVITGKQPANTYWIRGLENLTSAVINSPILPGGGGGSSGGGGGKPKKGGGRRGR